MRRPEDIKAQIEVYTAVIAGLNDALRALGKVVFDEHLPPTTRDFLRDTFDRVENERNFMLELKRATHELIDCQCEGMEHDPKCPASPKTLYSPEDVRISYFTKPEAR